MFKRNKIGGPDYIKKTSRGENSQQNKKRNTDPNGRKVMQNVL